MMTVLFEYRFDRKKEHNFPLKREELAQRALSIYRERGGPDWRKARTEVVLEPEFVRVTGLVD